MTEDPDFLMNRLGQALGSLRERVNQLEEYARQQQQIIAEKENLISQLTEALRLANERLAMLQGKSVSSGEQEESSMGG